jgi:hypothetical protein
MKEALVQLLLRRTETGCRNAYAAVLGWRAAIEAADTASHQAGFDLKLTSELTASTSRLEEEAKTANYVASVGIAARAAGARKEVLRAVTGQFEEELKDRRRQAEEAEKMLKSLRNDHDERRNGILAAKARSERPDAFYEPPDKLNAGGWAGCGCAAAVLAFFIDIMIAATGHRGLWNDAGGLSRKSAVGMALYAVGGPLVFLALMGVVHFARVSWRRGVANSRAAASLVEAETKLAREEESHRVQLPPCEAAAEHASQRVRLAVEAFDRFQAQA